MSAENKINWRERKVIAFESDDWGGPDRNGWVDVETYHRGMKHPAIAAAVKGNKWNDAMNTLESVRDLDELFSLLARFKGGDGRPAIFTPVYILASPDFDAIRANGFTKYVDIGIDKPYPEIWRSRGDIIGKASEGIELGVWCPESHNTRAAAHFDPHKWVRFLREGKDEALNASFELNMIGKPMDKVLNVGLEFDALNRPELEDWIKTGTQYFKNAFGYPPRLSGVADARNCCKILEDIMLRILSKNGVTTILNAVNRDMGEVDEDLGLTFIKRNAGFEPALTPETSVWESCYESVVKAWESNQPAIVNTHRINYASMDPERRSSSFKQLESLLKKIQREHPEAVYRPSHVIGAMYL